MALSQSSKSVAIKTPTGEISYGKLISTAGSTQTHLARLGVRRGDRVTISLRNDWRFVPLLLACLRHGCIAAPLSHRLPLEQLQIYLQTIRSRLHLLAAETNAGPLEIVRTVPIEEVVRPARLPGNDAEELLAPREQPATIIFTSGSTGEPKAVLHNLRNHYFSALGANMNMPLKPGDCWLLSLPVYHVGGLAIIFRTMLAGATVAFPAGHEPIIDSLQRFPVTHISLVATQLHRLLQDKSATDALRKLKAILLGGSAIPPSLIEQAHALDLPVFTTYGCTEMASQVTTTAPGDTLDHLLTSGKLLPYRQLQISREGEILVKGETLFIGYMSGNELSRPAGEQGWYATGDLGEIDPEGYLRITGRKDNMFISAGENIYPEEIEKALCDLPGIEQAIVVAIADQQFGHRPVAFIQPSAGTDFDANAILSRLAKALPRFKLPDRILPWPDHVSNAGVKVNRAFFRKLARTLE